MSRAPPRRIQPGSEFASSSRCVSTNACATALLISGTVDTRGIDFKAFHRHVVLPLVALGHEVDTYACLGTTDAPLPDWWGRLRHLFEDYGPSVSETNGVATKHASLAMYARLTSCWHYAMRSTAKGYSLFVYARPDILWWGPLRMPSNLNAVFVRARAIRLLADEQIHQQQMSIPCHSRLVAFANSVQVASDAESEGMVLDCFFIDDQMALVPARYARAYFDSGAEWHGKESCVSSRLSAGSCPLSMSQLGKNVSEKMITARLQRHCVPIVVHAFNASLGVKNVTRGVPPGGPGERRTVIPKIVMSNGACGVTFTRRSRWR